MKWAGLIRLYPPVQAGAIRIAVAAVSIGMLLVFFGYFLTENIVHVRVHF